MDFKGELYGDLHGFLHGLLQGESMHLVLQQIHGKQQHTLQHLQGQQQHFKHVFSGLNFLSGDSLNERVLVSFLSSPEAIVPLSIIFPLGEFVKLFVLYIVLWLKLLLLNP